MRIFYFATFELEFQIDPLFYVLNSKLLRPLGKFDLILETLVPVLILRFVRPSVFRNPFVLLLVDLLLDSRHWYALRPICSTRSQY